MSVGQASSRPDWVAKRRRSEGWLWILTIRGLLPDWRRFVSISWWRDEEAVRRWRNVQKHREAQKKGRAGIFSTYRLRVAKVLRDYGMQERAEAPADRWGG